MIASRARHRGFTLIEMIAVMILFGAFAVIATRLFVSSFKLTRDFAATHDATASGDFALAILRSDVSTAQRIETKDPHTADLTTPDGRHITWTIADSKFLRRVGDDQDQWTAPAIASFKSTGVCLILKVDDPKLAPTFGEIWMSSQSNLAEKLRTP